MLLSRVLPPKSVPTKSVPLQRVGIFVSVTALSAVLFGIPPAAADTLAPPPSEPFVSGVPERVPERTPEQAAAAPASVITPGALAPTSDATSLPRSAGDAPPALWLAAIPWTEPTDEEQPAPAWQALALPPPPPPPPPTPAELLRLTGKERAKAERCLANAVYFEARGEPLRGQVAVAQVVLNRVFSPYYPNDVCSVVYQNADRHLACQFTFACDGKSKAITDRRAWWRAQRVARLMLDGKVWLAAVAKSTHYHANYVSPAWTSEMRRTFRYGVHLFYRPYRWGEGEKELGWVEAPLPVLKPKAPSRAAVAQPQTKAATAAASAAAAAVGVAPANHRAPPTAGTSTAGQQRVAAAIAKPEAKPKPALSPQAKVRPESSAAKPATKRAKPADSQRQAKPAQRASLN